MNDHYYVSKQNKGKVWTVCSEPWMCCGTLVVKLEGKSGGYAVDGLDVVKHYHTKQYNITKIHFYCTKGAD